MIHELCSEYNRKTPCMTENKCSKRYPHGRTLTLQVKNQKAVVNNSRIVPYSLPLSKIFVSTEIRSRISNISVCHERKRHGCIFNNNEEISQYQMRRYVSSNGSVWRTFSFTIHKRHPAIVHLAVYLENGLVYFMAQTHRKELNDHQ